MELTKSEEDKKYEKPFTNIEQISQFLESQKEYKSTQKERREKKKKLKDIIDYKINEKHKPLQNVNQ